MNRADKLCVFLLICIAFLFYVPLWIQDQQNAQKEKEVVISYQGEEMIRESLKKDAVYEIQATLGEVLVEVRNQSVRVEKENSPYHLCSIQGWVSEANRPIICLPNELVVRIEALQEEDSLDTVVQ